MSKAMDIFISRKLEEEVSDTILINNPCNA